MTTELSENCPVLLPASCPYCGAERIVYDEGGFPRTPHEAEVLDEKEADYPCDTWAGILWNIKGEAYLSLAQGYECTARELNRTRRERDAAILKASVLASPLGTICDLWRFDKPGACPDMTRAVDGCVLCEAALRRAILDADPADLAARLKGEGGYRYALVAPREARRLDEGYGVFHFTEKGYENWAGLESGFSEKVFEAPGRCALYKIL